MEYSDQALLEQAREARERAYAPYSGFAVGAALLCRDGSVYLGCNVENASFSPTCCAERAAVFAAVSDGKRDFRAIAVIGGKEGEEGGPCPPCGVCRQVLSEFCPPDFPIILADAKGAPVCHPLGELLPGRFTLKD